MGISAPVILISTHAPEAYISDGIFIFFFQNAYGDWGIMELVPMGFPALPTWALRSRKLVYFFSLFPPTYMQHPR